MKKISSHLLKNLEAQKEAGVPFPVSTKKQKAPILALDFGKKFCGLAWSPDEVLTLPLGVFPTEKIEEVLQKIVDEKKIKKVVLGLPISSDGRENELCREIRSFAKKIQKVPVAFVNERGSSQATMVPDRNKRYDDMAAAQILEFFLRETQLKS